MRISFTFDQALSAAATPLTTVDAVFKGTQSRADCLNPAIPGDPFDNINGSQKSVTFAINGSAPASITGRPNNAATNLDYDANDLFGSWTPGTDLGGFLIGGEQIGIQGMTRWTGAFTGQLLFGDFSIRYAPGRINGTRSGLVLVSSIDFANATYADLANINLVVNNSQVSISGDLLYSNGFALLTNDPTDVGVKFGSFQMNAFTAVPEPGVFSVLSTAALGLTWRRGRKESK